MAVQTEVCAIRGIDSEVDRRRACVAAGLRMRNPGRRIGEAVRDRNGSLANVILRAMVDNML